MSGEENRDGGWGMGMGKEMEVEIEVYSENGVAFAQSLLKV